MSKSTSYIDTVLQSALSEMYLKAFSKGLTRAEADAAFIRMTLDKLDSVSYAEEAMVCLILLRRAL